MKVTSELRNAFTLIELMVTLSIVTILTIAAIPFLKNYINQSKVSDAISAAAVVQTMVAKQVARNESVTASGTGLTLPSSLGRYVSSFSVSSAGVISITTTNSASSVSLTLTPSFSASTQLISWTCAVTSSSFNDLVPAPCRI